MYTKELTSKDVKQKPIPSITQDTFNTGANEQSQLINFQKLPCIFGIKSS